MLEGLKHHVNLPGLFIVLGVVVVVGGLGLWGVHRTSGRPIREMLALLAAALVLIAFIVPVVIISDEWAHSPDLAIRKLTQAVSLLIILPIAFVIWRFFNKLSKPKLKTSSHSRGHGHEPIA